VKTTSTEAGQTFGCYTSSVAVARQKRIKAEQAVKTGKLHRPTRKSKRLLAEAFSHPEGSPERRQVFSKYLNALHDEHAKLRLSLA
jgi:hypothetical protein